MIVVDSVTHLDGRARHQVVVCGSHGGAFSGAFAARRGVRAIVLHDAGVGRDRAGIAGLAILGDHGIAACAVSTAQAVIGDGDDTLASGVVTHVNAPAERLGCHAGATAAATAELLERMAPRAAAVTVPADESTHLLADVPVRVWALDSVSAAAGLGDDDAVLFTGSHANLLGGRPETALRGSARLAVFNDAGVPAGRGLTRLPELDRRGIPAAAVDAATARIGDGRSTYEDGVVSACNVAARALGADAGMPARNLLDLMVVHV